jgi:hypothetical protein
MSNSSGSDIICSVTTNSVIRQAREEYFTKMAMARWSQVPQILVLGSHTAMRLPIFSVVIHNTGPHANALLSHNFVVAVLSDLFGIQVHRYSSNSGHLRVRLP